ncbi:hypothetical protein BDR07DRAFT_522623 [Suillus spraguei]|nr:hypothetical protein BDR07DRAFT_522623 [Suillus spraguei]
MCSPSSPQPYSLWFHPNSISSIISSICASSSLLQVVPNWLPRLKGDSHIKRCSKIMPVFCDKPPSFFYLAGIFLCIEVASRERSAWTVRFADIPQLILKSDQCLYRTLLFYASLRRLCAPCSLR